MEGQPHQYPALSDHKSDNICIQRPFRKDRNRAVKVVSCHTLCSFTKNLLQAINKGYFTTSPNMMVKLITKHLPHPTAISECHMLQTRKNFQ